MSLDDDRPTTILTPGNASRIYGELCKALLIELDLENAEGFRENSKFGLFGGHRLKRLYTPDGVAPDAVLELHSLVRDLMECRDCRGIELLKDDLKNNHKYWSSKFQLAVGAALKRRGHAVEFERSVDAEGRLLEASPHPDEETRVDIRLPDELLNIEVVQKKVPFFRSIRWDFFTSRLDSLPDPDLLIEYDLSCSVEARSVVSWDDRSLKTLQDYLLEEIPRAFEGRMPPPLRGIRGLTVEFSRKEDGPPIGEEHDRLQIQLDGGQRGPTLFIRYLDKTSPRRVLADFRASLRKYSKQLVSYPPEEGRVIAACLPDTLVRAAELYLKDQFPRELRLIFQRWLRSQAQNNITVELDGLLLGEEVIKQEGEKKSNELYLWAIAHGESEAYNSTIVNLVERR